MHWRPCMKCLLIVADRVLKNALSLSASPLRFYLRLSLFLSLRACLVQSSRMKMQNQIGIWNGNGNKLIEREKKNKHTKKRHTHDPIRYTHWMCHLRKIFNSQTLWWTFAHRVCIKKRIMHCTLLLFSPARFAYKSRSPLSICTEYGWCCTR